MLVRYAAGLRGCEPNNALALHVERGAFVLSARWSGGSGDGTNGT
jgi:hypothetical protein